jgi:hypothetical protein
MLRHRTLPALLFSALNLWMMEYFFPLEFARLGFIWTALREQYPVARDRIKPALRLWAPYLTLFALAVISRLLYSITRSMRLGSPRKKQVPP